MKNVISSIFKIYFFALISFQHAYSVENAKEAPSTINEEYDLPKEEKLKAIWHMYGYYCYNLSMKDSYVSEEATKQHDYYDFTSTRCYSDIRKLHKTMGGESPYPPAFDKLDITLPWSDIVRIFTESGVIQLRPIEQNSHQLLLGCGNFPINGFYRALRHDHKGMTTINTEISYNPTIVATFGMDDLSKVLPPNQYDSLVFEFFSSLPNITSVQLALKGPYFKENYSTYHVVDEPSHTQRGQVMKDAEGYDVLKPYDVESIMVK